MISEDLKQDIRSFDNFRQETIEKTYDDVAQKYDTIMLGMGHPDPEHCAKICKELPLSPQSLIFDFGCGTGLVGDELVKQGFNPQSIWGCDASQGMLDVCEQKKSYGNLTKMFLGQPDKFPKELYNKFDVITAAGILAEGHLMCEVFDEMIHALKQHGYAIFTTREMYLDKYGYGAYIDQLEKRGYWRKIETRSFKRYSNIQQDEVIGRFKTVEAMAFVYQKL